MYKRSNAFRVPGRRGRGPSPGAQAGRPYRWCSGGSQAAVPSEPLGRRGRGPSLGALALTMLTWGPQEEPKRARALRGSRLDVHTELQIVCVQRSVSTYIQKGKLFVYVGALLGPPPQKKKSVRWVYVTIYENKSIRPPCSYRPISFTNFHKQLPTPFVT